jgi:serine/threonine protein kinase HipA of HipAB toxin-antitoxin module
MTVREKTVKLQRNVTELELALNQKDQRIQLLNARLARLQQQLKAQQADKKAN